MTQYAWKRHPKGAPRASVAGKYLTTLNRKHKGVSAEVLVQEAADKASPLHPCFEWNDSFAATQYRLEQARLVIRSLMVVVQENDDEEPIQVNAFVTFEDQPEYLSIQTVIADEELDLRYKTALLADLKSTKRKCSSYDEFAEVCHAIDKIRIR